MKDRRLAARYAEALLSVLTDPKEAEAADQFLAAIRKALEQMPEFRAVMRDPSVAPAARKALLRSLAEQKQMPARVVNFLGTLVDHNRTSALPAIAEVYHEAREQALGIVPAAMATARPIDSRTQEQARVAFEKLTGRQVRLTCSVDPALIGGAVTRIGSTVYDGSLRTQLDQLRRRLSQE